jgi:hypothetical protein
MSESDTAKKRFMKLVNVTVVWYVCPGKNGRERETGDHLTDGVAHPNEVV